MTVTLAVLLLALVVATATDIARHKIYNWTTYPGMLACLATAAWQEGVDGLTGAVLGGVVCGGLMLASYLCLDVGGGDVKLAALMGTGLGWAAGLYALLWTFTLAGGLAAAAIIWRLGIVRIAASLLRRRTVDEPQDPVLESELRRPLFLAPAALVAVVIVTAPAMMSPPRGHTNPATSRVTT